MNCIATPCCNSYFISLADFITLVIFLARFLLVLDHSLKLFSASSILRLKQPDKPLGVPLRKKMDARMDFFFSNSSFFVCAEFQFAGSNSDYVSEQCSWSSMFFFYETIKARFYMKPVRNGLRFNSVWGPSLNLSRSGPDEWESPQNL